MKGKIIYKIILVALLTLSLASHWYINQKIEAVDAEVTTVSEIKEDKTGIYILDFNTISNIASKVNKIIVRL